LFAGGWAVSQLWLFWLAPVLGAAAAGFVSKLALEDSVQEPPITGRVQSGAPARAYGQAE
jgi:aquaporin Z